MQDFERCKWNNVVVDFDAIVAEHKDAVYRQMIRVFGNYADAEDGLIETLLKAYKHLDQLRDSVVFRSWLAQIARRVCWQLKKRQTLRPLLRFSELKDEGKHIPAHEEELDSQLAALELKQLLQKIVDELPDEYRQVYQLRDVEGFPGEEVAALLGLSVTAMKSRLHRARELIRERLDQVLAGNIH